MRNDIVKNKKLFSQYKFKLIKTIWNYFEHTELPQNEISNFFIEQDSLSNGKRIPNKVVIIKRGIIKQQSNISNTNQQVIYEETKSEELIHQSFETLKSIENGIIDDAHLIQAIDNMVIILETLLSSIIIESPEIDLLLSEFSNAFAALSNDLYGTKVEIHEKDRPDGNAESILKILSNLLMDSQSHNDSAFSLAVYDILQTITENKKASEKTKAYVNDVFISLLAYYLCSQMKARGISLEQWFKDLTTHNLSEDKIAFKDYIDLGCDLLPFDAQRALRFLCSRDIQYWRKKIISSLKYNAKRNPGVYTNFSKSFFASIELILSHLNIYRNMAAHSSYDYMDDRWLLRCLETIVLFTESFGFPVEKTLLEKRLFFERYRIYGNKMGKTFKCYSDVDYSLFSHTSIISVRDWKSITVKKETIDQTPVTIDILRERASEIVRRVFEPRSVMANEEIDKLIDYYRLNSVLFPFFVSRNSFEELLRAGYPFNPSFFVVTRNLCFSDVLSLATECVEEALLSEQSESMIMPYRINQNNPIISKYFIDYFAAGSYLDYDYSIAASSHFWKILQESALNINSQEITNISRETGYSPVLLSNVAKTIALLSVDLFCPKGVERNRDWLRLVCTQPENEIAEVEGSIDLINEYSLFIISSVPIETTQYRFVRPSIFADRINTIQSNKRMLSNAEMVNKEGLGKLKCNLSTLYMDYLNRNGYKLTEEEKSRKVKEFVKKAVGLVEDESYYTLDFIAFLSSIHSI